MAGRRYNGVAAEGSQNYGQRRGNGSLALLTTCSTPTIAAENRSKKYDVSSTGTGGGGGESPSGRLFWLTNGVTR